MVNVISNEEVLDWVCVLWSNTLNSVHYNSWFVLVLRYTLFIALYPIGVMGELLCLHAAQAYVASKKLWSLEMPNKLNLTFSYHYFLLFIMFLYIPCKLYKFMMIKVDAHYLFLEKRIIITFCKIQSLNHIIPLFFLVFLTVKVDGGTICKLFV